MAAATFRSAVTNAAKTTVFSTSNVSTHDTMSCMTCVALNGRRLCDPCATSKANNLISSLASHGVPINVAHLQFCQQIVQTATQTGKAFEETELVLQHTFAKIFQVATSQINANNLSHQQLTYAQVHCTKYGFWFESTNNVFLRTTPLKLHNKKSILQKLDMDPIKGLPLNECVKEYDTAYLDLYNLIQSGHIVARKGYIWKTPPK